MREISPRAILKSLKKTYPDWKCELFFRDSWQLLVAVMLSAQCTDERVNTVTPALFARFPTVTSFALATQKEMEKMIYSTGFYRNKAKNILAAAKMVVTDFGGEVPKTMKELLLLPGVARKTANVVLSVAYNLHDGVVVDTHVMRLSKRMGLTKNKTPEKIETDLMKLVPQKQWGDFHLLVAHGRRFCMARRPMCEACPVTSVCPKIGVSL